MTAGENAAANDATAVQGEETNNAAVVAEPPAVVAAATQQESKEDNGSDDDDADEGGAGLSDAVRLQKRKERLEQNRISARESRKRKKTMIEELQRTVITLSKENKDLNDRNEQLRSQLMEIGRKYPNAVPIQAIMNGAPPPAPQPVQGTTTAAILQQQHAGVADVPMAVFSPQALVQQANAAATDATAIAPAGAAASDTSGPAAPAS